MSCGIYRYTNLINGKRYIGQSVNIEGRFKTHLKEANNEPRLMIDKAISKYGIENFRFEILEFCEREQLNELETYWIDYYYTFVNREDGLGYGYNVTKGGGGLYGIHLIPWNKGIHLNKETKDKLSKSLKGNKAHLGYKHSEETKQKLREKNIGKKQTKETIEKRCLKTIGLKRSDEFKLQISNDKKRRKPIWKNDKQKYVKEDVFLEYINNGWNYGLNPIIVQKREITRKTKRKYT